VSRLLGDMSVIFSRVSHTISNCIQVMETIFGMDNIPMKHANNASGSGGHKLRVELHLGNYYC
jgi:hypothetical protein